MDSRMNDRQTDKLAILGIFFFTSPQTFQIVNT